MSTVSNVVTADGMVSSWREGNATFFVSRNTKGRPTTVYSKRGKWVDQECFFAYDSSGAFTGLVGKLVTDLLPALLADATGTVKSSSASPGLVLSGRNVLADSIGTHRTRRLTRNICGRVKAYTATAAHTVCIAFELETDAISFRVGIPNIHTATVAGVKCQVAVTDAVVANAASRYTPSTGVWNPVTFSAAASVTLPARIAAERPSMTFSDEINLQTIPRLDGIKRPWLLVMLEYPNAAILSVPFSGFYYWHTTGAADGRKCFSTYKAVAGITTPGSFVSAAGEFINTVIPAITYTAKKPGRQVLAIGDSTVEGIGATVTNYSATLHAALQLSTPEDPVEVFTAAIHSQSSAVYVERIADLFNTVKPTHVVYSPWSGNDAAIGGMTTAQQLIYHAAFTRALTLLDQQAVRILLLEGLPVNAAYKDYGAGDATRRALNTALKSYVGGQISVATGYAAAYSGAEDADGQTTVLEGYTSDNCHPNSVGVPYLAECIKPWLMY